MALTIGQRPTRPEPGGRHCIYQPSTINLTTDENGHLKTSFRTLAELTLPARAPVACTKPGACELAVWPYDSSVQGYAAAKITVR